MSKPILAGVAVVALAAGVGGYALTSGAPAAPKGGCPALVSVAPYNANVVAYGDLANLRKSGWADKMNPAAGAPLPKDYQDFITETNFHIEKDLDHVMLEGSFDAAAGAVVLEGRFDKDKISSYVAKLGSKTHYESGDVYLFPTHTATGTVALMFIGPNRLAITMGKSAETQALMLADAALNSDPSAHEDMCARAQRVSGAPFFMVGDVPKSGALAMAAMASRNSDAADVIQSLQSWDLATWSDGNNFRIEMEGEYATFVDALKARMAFEKLRKAIKDAGAEVKSGAMASSAAAPAVDALIKNFGIAIDGRYVRISTSISQANVENLQRAAASMAGPAFGAPSMGAPVSPARRR